MECPHCGFGQPEGVECVQCHVPLGELADLLHRLDLEVPPTSPAPPTLSDGGDEHRSEASPPRRGSAAGDRGALAERVRLTTGSEFSGLGIRAYRGLVSAQVWVPMDPSLGSANAVVSLRTCPMGAHLDQALAVGIGDLRLATVKVGGNAVITVKLDYQSGFAHGVLVSLTGTAVEVIRERRG